MRIIFLLNVLFPTFILSQNLQRVEYQYQAMGTQFRFIVYSSDTLHAKTILHQSIKHINRLNTIFSDYDEASEICRLSAKAGSSKKIKISPELWTILKRANSFSKESDGAFDATIGPLSKLWRSMFRKKELFSTTKIATKHALVNYQNIKFYPLSKRVKLLQKGMRIDLGGIAKGFTVDKVADFFIKNDLEIFLIDGGGDIRVGAPPPHQKGWTINVTLENETGKKVMQKIIATHTAIASSGDTYRFLEWNGNHYSHIIDPRTGYGVTHRKIINIQAPTCTIADAIASTLSVLKPTEWDAFLKKQKKVHIITGN